MEVRKPTCYEVYTTMEEDEIFDKCYEILKNIQHQMIERQCDVLIYNAEPCETVTEDDIIHAKEVLEILKYVNCME